MRILSRQKTERAPGALTEGRVNKTWCSCAVGLTGSDPCSNTREPQKDRLCVSPRTRCL